MSVKKQRQGSWSGWTWNCLIISLRCKFSLHPLSSAQPSNLKVTNTYWALWQEAATSLLSTGRSTSTFFQWQNTSSVQHTEENRTVFNKALHIHLSTHPPTELCYVYGKHKPSTCLLSSIHFFFHKPWNTSLNIQQANKIWMKGHPFKTTSLLSMVHVAPRDNSWENIFDTKRLQKASDQVTRLGWVAHPRNPRDLLVPWVPGGQGATQHFTAVLHNVAMAIGILDTILSGPWAFDLQDKSQGLH